MANLGKKNGIYLARFRYNGKEYKKSLKTTDHKTAEAAMHRVEDALYRLAIKLSGQRIAVFFLRIHLQTSLKTANIRDLSSLGQ